MIIIRFIDNRDILNAKLIIFIFSVRISIAYSSYVLGFQYTYLLYNYYRTLAVFRMYYFRYLLFPSPFPVRDATEIKAFRNNEVKGCGTFPHFPFSFPGGNSPEDKDSVAAKRRKIKPEVGKR